MALDPITLGIIGGAGALGGMFGGKSEFNEIDPEEVGGYFDKGGYVQGMARRSEDLMDPNSAYNTQVLDRLKQSTSDQVFAQNLLARRNAAASGMLGQSGVLDSLQQSNTRNAYNNMQQQFQQGMSQNLDRSNTLLGQAAQFDLAKGEAMASAYGQNITNQNNMNAAQAGNAMQMGSGIASAAVMAMSDKRKKENIKKVGRAKTKDGKSVNLYSFNFKGSKKKNVGVIAQEIEKSHPKHVKKQKNGTLMVNYGGLF